MQDKDITEIYHLFEKQTENGLKSILNQIPGAKVIAIDPNLKDIIDKVYKFIFKEKQVYEISKLVYLDSASKVDLGKTLVFFVNSDPKVFKQICTQINHETAFDRKGNRKYVILVINTLSNVCENMLEEYGCFGHVDLHEVPLNLMPLDTDLYSSEQMSYLSTLYLQNDKTPLRSVVKGILQLESQFGRPNQIATIGRNASSCLKLLNKLLNYDKEHNHGRKFELQNDQHKNYEKLIIFDREVDFITPLVAADTVESMIDDTFKIKTGSVTVDKAIVNGWGSRILG